jgi:hypothetical protein
MSRRTPRAPPRFGSYVLSLPLARRKREPPPPEPEIRLNDLFFDLLRLIARLLAPLDRTRLRAACRATWEADRHSRLPRPLQTYLETFPWWLPRDKETIATCLRWREHRHLFAPWIGLCDTPVFSLLERDRLVPTIAEGRLIFRAPLRAGAAQRARHLLCALPRGWGQGRRRVLLEEPRGDGRGMYSPRTARLGPRTPRLLERAAGAPREAAVQVAPVGRMFLCYEGTINFSYSFLSLGLGARWKRA